MEINILLTLPLLQYLIKTNYWNKTNKCVKKQNGSKIRFRIENIIKNKNTRKLTT